MRSVFGEELEAARLRSGRMASATGDTFGFFSLKLKGIKIKVIASAGIADVLPWEHVSVSTPIRCPTWEEMNHIKGLFWEDEEAVMQLHPPRSEYVNYHPFTLHMWRPLAVEIPLPPSITVGPKCTP